MRRSEKEIVSEDVDTVPPELVFHVTYLGENTVLKEPRSLRVPFNLADRQC